MNIVKNSPIHELAREKQAHFIDLDGFGIESDDYDVFLKARAKCIYDELKARIELTHKEPVNEELEELISSDEGVSIEFKSTLRYDLRTQIVNKKQNDTVFGVRYSNLLCY